MTPRQIALVRSSFQQVVPIAGPAAKLFYGRLFELDPELRPLFKNNLEDQGNKLMAMIGTAVAMLNRLDKLLPVAQDLGRRHAVYGVEDQHYETVGLALLWTLEKCLGGGFTLEVEQAWAAAYGLLSTTMRKAASEIFANA